jgi:hypothetical protein
MHTHTHLGGDDRGQDEEAEEQRRHLVLGGHAGQGDLRPGHPRAAAGRGWKEQDFYLYKRYGGWMDGSYAARYIYI